MGGARTNSGTSASRTSSREIEALARAIDAKDKRPAHIDESRCRSRIRQGIGPRETFRRQDGGAPPRNRQMAVTEQNSSKPGQLTQEEFKDGSTRRGAESRGGSVPLSRRAADS